MRVGFLAIGVLEFLNGEPFDDVSKSYLRALRPSEVRVIPRGGIVTSDAISWRVTVYLRDRDTIDWIEQEVEVDLPDGIEHGHALSCRLMKRQDERRDVR